MEELKCSVCNKKMEMFNLRDEHSIEEFKSSGMCQGCQDAFFDDIEKEVLIEEDLL